MTTLIIRPDGQAVFGRKSFRCAVGRAGVTKAKREGDEATPVGTWRMRSVFYRADRIERPETALAIRPIEPDDGWCDDPSDAFYNRLVRLPYHANAERLWRDDRAYDLIVPLGYNDDPPVPELGSAIFLHIAREDFTGTLGCLALAEKELREVLHEAHSASRVVILPRN